MTRPRSSAPQPQTKRPRLRVHLLPLGCTILLGIGVASCGDSESDRASPRQGGINDGLVLWYTFDNVSGNNGDLVSNVAPDYIGMFDGSAIETELEPNDLVSIASLGYPENRALRFDNENTPSDPHDVAWVKATPRLHSLGDGAPFAESTEITVSARVKIDTDDVEFNFLCYGCGPVYAWSVGVWNNPRGRMRFFPENGGSWTPYSSHAAEDLIPNEEWTYVTAVIVAGTADVDGERGSIHFYKNCEDVTLDPVPPPGDVLDFEDFVPSMGNSTLVGYGGGNANYAFEGAIDDLKVWNRALSAEEIQDLCVLKGSALSAVWANSGSDKVIRDELRATPTESDVTNSTWDGQKISIFGARNEVVSFNLVLEAGSGPVSEVDVDFDNLAHQSANICDGQPDCVSVIQSAPPSAEPPPAHAGLSFSWKDGLFDWRERNIELFFVRYLEIKGLSKLAYGNYDERHIPEGLQRPVPNPLLPYVGSGTWNDRPNHNKEYPEIAAPIELHSGFDIPEGLNQSIWADISIPRDAAPGTYMGTVVITEAGEETRSIPVELQVHDFTLPEDPSSKTMVVAGGFSERYFSDAAPSSRPEYYDLVVDRHFQVAHRHRISLINSNTGVGSWTQDAPRPAWRARLDGSLFTEAYGYDGPGEGTGNNVFSIGTYSSWSWINAGVDAEGDLDEAVDKQAMWDHTDAWEQWFQSPTDSDATPLYDNTPEGTALKENVASTERFLYLIDEPASHGSSFPLRRVNQWSEWVNQNPGIGGDLDTFVTIDPMHHYLQTPALDISAFWMGAADTCKWQGSVKNLRDANRKIWAYNGQRPAVGSFSTEDEGSGLRMLPWAQHKYGIGRWFAWQSTYYDSVQFNAAPAPQTDVFTTAQTFGNVGSAGGDPDLNLELDGIGGYNHSNGEGVLFYPGTDCIYPESSYNEANDPACDPSSSLPPAGVPGPLASLRLKHWRRGIQDVEYIVEAKKHNDYQTTLLVQKMVPRALWDVGVTTRHDPSYIHEDISWTTDADAWEDARECLLEIIATGETTCDLDGVAITDQCPYVTANGLLFCDPSEASTCPDAGQCVPWHGQIGFGRKPVKRLGYCASNACVKYGDCASNDCNDGICAVSTCDDGWGANGLESDVDCGGFSSCGACAQDKRCIDNFSCESGVCANTRCQAPTCSDGVRNGDETRVDCGGATCLPCAEATCSDGAMSGDESGVDCGSNCGSCPGITCAADEECASNHCGQGTCAATTCNDRIKNGTESGIDCGGICGRCAGTSCLTPWSDDGVCASNVCANGVCQKAFCGDGAINAEESGVDCGVTAVGVGTCHAGQPCSVADDCASGSCSGGFCQIETCESASDCTSGICWEGFCYPAAGECNAPSCEICGQPCGDDEDCPGAVCQENVCLLPAGTECFANGSCTSANCMYGMCQPPTCDDGIANGEETDVDCGEMCDPELCAAGLVCESDDDCLAPGECLDRYGILRCRHPAGEACNSWNDCISMACVEGLCSAPSCTDVLYNGDETDTDCGGSCPPCSNSHACNVNADCSSGVCFANGCRSCNQYYPCEGGKTCVEGVCE